MHTRSWLRIVAVVVTILLQPLIASAAPQVGWWWNASESGRGFFIESQNGIVYLAGYFYESDGRATWLVSGGPNADPYSYSGRLLAYRGGQTLFGDYQPPAAPTDAGAVSLSFSDDTHGTLTWPGGAIAIERQVFGGPTDDPYPPDPGWWWNDQEGGRGYSVEVQGDSIFIVAFMYDEAGNPLWYYSAGQMVSEDEYEGPWLQFANGQTLTGPYHPPTTPVPVGKLSVEFTAIDEATLEFTDDVTAATSRVQPAAGRSTTIEIKREFPAKPTYKPARRYAGVFHANLVNDEEDFLDGETITTIKMTANLVWATDLDLPDLPAPGKRGTSYTYTLVEPRSVHVTFTETQEGGAFETHCRAEFETDVDISTATLNVNTYAQYTGTLTLVPAIVHFPRTCTLSDGRMETSDGITALHGDAPFVGKAHKDSLTRKMVLHPGGEPTLTLTVDWTFAVIVQ